MVDRSLNEMIQRVLIYFVDLITCLLNVQVNYLSLSYGTIMPIDMPHDPHPPRLNA